MMMARGLPHFYLQPGEVHFSETPALVTTILGSCISVTMYSAPLGLGGICHVLLPRCPRDSCTSGCIDVYRYAECSVKGMVAWFVEKGARREEIEVKIFGGSHLLALDPGQDYASVGKQNIHAVKKTLHKEGLSIQASHTGGRSGRKIIFFTHTGEVLMKRIKKTAAGLPQTRCGAAAK
jgi:chemotaxis protein CheD